MTRAQLRAWLPAGRRVLVDVSGPHSASAELAASAGHSVLRVLGGLHPGRAASAAAAEDDAAAAAEDGAAAAAADGAAAAAADGAALGLAALRSGALGSGALGSVLTAPAPAVDGTAAGPAGRAAGPAGRAAGPAADRVAGNGHAAGPAGNGRAAGYGRAAGPAGNGRAAGNGRVAGRGARQARPDGPPPGRIVRLMADPGNLSFLRDGCADGVIADDRMLSVNLVAETLVAEIARVLRPGGRVLACVDSLVLGMAVLADQHHWAHLVDLPHAEVVLVPWPDGTITRCYGPDQARELFGGAGLRVSWIRPRTVFSESMVTHVLRRDPGSMPRLVEAELAATADEALGAQLVIAASKPATRRR